MNSVKKKIVKRNLMKRLTKKNILTERRNSILAKMMVSIVLKMTRTSRTHSGAKSIKLKAKLILLTAITKLAKILSNAQLKQLKMLISSNTQSSNNTLSSGLHSRKTNSISNNTLKLKVSPMHKVNLISVSLIC